MTHGLLISNAFYSGDLPSKAILERLMGKVETVPMAAEYPYPDHLFGKGSLPRVLCFHRRHWGRMKRLFSRRSATVESAYRDPPFEIIPWSGLPFIPSDILKYCDGLRKNSWNHYIDKCAAILHSNESQLMEWARRVRVRPNTEIVTFVGGDQVDGFLRAVALWKFPERTKVRVISLDLPADVLRSAGNWPDGFSFYSPDAVLGDTAGYLAEGNRVCESDAWIWLDPEAISVGLSRAATLFWGKEWYDADWGAPGRYLVNECLSQLGKLVPTGWPQLDAVHWMGEPATLFRKQFVTNLLRAWDESGAEDDFERFASKFATEIKAVVRLANLHQWGWRMN